jgi:hypothetical protein
MLSSFGKLRYGLESAFFLIIVFSALRYNYGNDYPAYHDAFTQISKIPNLNSLFSLFDGPFDKYQGTEVGWVVLNWLFKPLGFSGLVIFTSIITNIVYYKLIKTFVPQKWYWLAIFTYIFNTSLFFVPLSMMRQSCCMVLFVISFKYIAERKILKSLLIILITVLFHKSALILLPFAFFGFLSYVDGKIISVTFISLFVIFMLTGNFTSDAVNAALMLESFEDYENYFDIMEAGESFGLGFISRLLTFLIPFLFYCADTTRTPFQNRLVVSLAAISFLIIPFTLVLGFLGRLGYYFSIFDIVAIPLLYGWMKNKTLRLGLIALYMAYVVFSFIDFFSLPQWKSFTHYQTIFS